MTADERTACYQLRAKRTGLSRQSTLSLSRIMVCKETPVRPPYDLCYFPIIDGNRQYVYHPNIPSVMGPMHAICLQLKVVEQSCFGDNVMGSALVLLLLSPAHRDHSPLPESNHSSHRASITPYIVPHWPRSTTRHLSVNTFLDYHPPWTLAAPTTTCSPTVKLSSTRAQAWSKITLCKNLRTRLRPTWSHLLRIHTPQTSNLTLAVTILCRVPSRYLSGLRCPN
jgi:hypothetical protein